MIKLVASDMDGTLLRNGADDLSEYTLELITKLLDRGIHFVAASGRQYASLRRLFAPIKDRISYISENGSLCVHEGVVVSKSFIPRELGLRIFDAIEEYSAIHSDRSIVLLSCEDVAYLDIRDKDYQKIFIESAHTDVDIVDGLANIEKDFLKIAVLNNENTKQLENFLRERFESEIRLVTSAAYWIDFLAPGANKGKALEDLAHTLGISASECIAFGDEYNDIDMLSFVKTGYAMKNAAPGVSYYADDTTETVEEVLEELLL